MTYQQTAAFKVCACKTTLQRGYLARGPHSHYTPGFYGFSCVVCGRHYDKEGRVVPKRLLRDVPTTNA